MGSRRPPCLGLKGVDRWQAASRRTRAWLLPALLLLLSASGSAAGAGARADFVYEGPSSIRGDFRGACEGRGISFADVARRALDFESEGGVLVTRRILVNETTVLDGTSPVATPPEAAIAAESSPVAAGRVSVAWPEAGKVVGLPLQAGDPAPSFPVALVLTGANASSVEAAPKTPAGDYWVDTPAGPKLQPSYFPGWVRRVSWAGSARVEGSITLYLREAIIEVGHERRDLGSYAVERENVSSPVLSRRTWQLEDAFLHLKAARIQLPEGAHAFCGSLNGSLAGDLVAARATGVVEAPTQRIPFETQVLSLRGRFDWGESPERLPLESASEGRMTVHASGDMAVVGVDFAPVVGGPLPVVAPVVGMSLAAGALAWLLYKNAGLVVGLFYSRFGRDAALNNANRSLLYEAVRSDPGVELTNLARVASLHLTTVAYHVQVLRRVGLVSTHRQGRTVHVFVAPAGTPVARTFALAARDERLAALIGMLREGPLPQRALAFRLRDRFSITVRAAYHMIERAVEAGTVERIRGPQGVSVRCSVANSEPAPS